MVFHTDMSDLLNAIDEVHASDRAIAEVMVSFVCPDKTKRKEALESFADTTAVVDANGVAGVKVEGTREGGVTGAYEVIMHDAGEFANNYKITFAYTQGYDKTKAVWDENNLTVTICANSSIADVNKAILEASNGNTKKMMTFTSIQGLSDNPAWSYTEDPATPGSYIITQTDIYGMTRVSAPIALANPPASEADFATATWGNYIDVDGKPVPAGSETLFFTGDPTTPSGPNAVTGKDETVAGTVWNPGMREAFFGGNTAISPAGGKDSFFTGDAKSLSTFGLADGRKGEEQSFKDFSDITVQQDGRIIGLHSVHGYVEIGRIDIAQFDNPNGLAKVGGTNFQETVASGAVKLSVAGEGGAGVVLSGALEMSNVDLADEFTNMITTQRGYQANSRVITDSDTMLEELLSLKR